MSDEQMGGMRSGGGECAQQVVTSNEDGCGKKGFRKTYFCEFEIKFQTIVPQCK